MPDNCKTGCACDAYRGSGCAVCETNAAWAKRYEELKQKYEALEINRASCCVENEKKLKEALIEIEHTKDSEEAWVKTYEATHAELLSLREEIKRLKGEL